MKLKDRTGERFGKLTVTSLHKRAENRNRQAQWLCTCDCGQNTIVRSGNLVTGTTRSCGCLRITAAKERITHGYTSGGKTATYNCWAGMRQRCLNSRYKNYLNYGGRGIRICNRWSKFENFLEDMGERPIGLSTLDRIDPNGNYEPSNCRWADRTTQARNQRRKRLEQFSIQELMDEIFRRTAA